MYFCSLKYTICIGFLSAKIVLHPTPNLTRDVRVDLGSPSCQSCTVKTLHPPQPLPCKSLCFNKCLVFTRIQFSTAWQLLKCHFLETGLWWPYIFSGLYEMIMKHLLCGPKSRRRFSEIIGVCVCVDCWSLCITVITPITSPAIAGLGPLMHSSYIPSTDCLPLSRLLLLLQATTAASVSFTKYNQNLLN